MRRRACLRWLGSALVAPVLPFATSAQQGVHRLAFVHSAIPADKLTESAGPFWVRRVYQTLRELGDVEGENLIVERFSADGRSERFASLAAEVVGRKPDVIILNFIELAKVFMVITSTIPLVAIIGDPIVAGLLTSLAHPGGNLTGVSINAGIEIYGKRLQIIKEAMPKVTKVAALFSGPLSGKSVYQEAATKLGIELTSREVTEVNEVQLRRTFARRAQRAQVSPSFPLTSGRSRRLFGLLFCCLSRSPLASNRQKHFALTSSPLLTLLNFRCRFRRLGLFGRKAALQRVH